MNKRIDKWVPITPFKSSFQTRTDRSFSLHPNQQGKKPLGRWHRILRNPGISLALLIHLLIWNSFIFPLQAGENKVIRLSQTEALELVKIRPGTFMMGMRPGDLDGYPNKELPRHPVSLTKSFWMGKFEVTQAQWLAVMGTSPWSGKQYVRESGKFPAVYISWSEAEQFVRRLSDKTGLPFRLPTEAEWEYACRAGTVTRFYWGDDPNYTEIGEHAWWRGNACVKEENYAHEVGHFPPNPWGLFDMSGNASEWCSDWHSFYPDSAVTNPTGPQKADHRVLRGGSWSSLGGHCRSSRRHHELPEMARGDFGLRVLLDEPVQTDETAFSSMNLFTAGEEGVNTYRIPSLLLAPDNTLLAFCEARKQSVSDASPTDLVLRRSTDGGKHWLPTQVLVRGQGNEALMNPCPVVDRSNHRILLFCMNANKFGPNLNQLLLLTSDDNGQSWTTPMEIGKASSGWDLSFVSGPGVGIQLKSGRLLIPGYMGHPDEELEENSRSCAIYSDDHGKSWKMGHPVDQFSDESQAVELKDGSVMLNMRGNMGMSCRGVAISRNGGESWQPVRWDHTLNECPCQASIVRYGTSGGDGKQRILFANPDNSGEKFGILDRTRMTVRMSYDEGKSWPVRKLIHAGPSSYSTMVRLSDGTIAMLFEGGEHHRREWIRFVRFTLDWLTDGMEEGPFRKDP
ncbi:MAG: SUMF1/EgtB/PvdO family nonheme iron enzyme [Marinilabiliales bacterium]|nr:SUMF1/EgtB/PvdO family nonheme iron enzyme [Marinilabiliales bacterium]